MSPLHNVALHLRHIYVPTVPTLTSAVKQMLTAYYKSPGLKCPREVDHLAISLRNEMVVDATSFPTAPCSSTHNLRLQSVEAVNLLVAEILPPLPLGHTRMFAATELALVENDWRAVLQKVEGLSHLQLDSLDIGPVMGALGLDDRGARRKLPNSRPILHTQRDKPHPPVAPKLQSLSLNNLDMLSGRDQQLFDVLEQRFNNRIGLKGLVVQTCRVLTVGYRRDLESVVEEITWKGVTEMGWDYEGSELDDLYD